MTIELDDFMNVDVRVGRITRVEDFPEARKPAWKLFLDYGGESDTLRELRALPDAAAGSPETW